MAQPRELVSFFTAIRRARQDLHLKSQDRNLEPVQSGPAGGRHLGRAEGGGPSDAAPTW